MLNPGDIKGWNGFPGQIEISLVLMQDIFSLENWMIIANTAKGVNLKKKRCTYCLFIAFKEENKMVVGGRWKI